MLHCLAGDIFIDQRDTLACFVLPAKRSGHQINADANSTYHDLAELLLTSFHLFQVILYLVGAVVWNLFATGEQIFD